MGIESGSVKNPQKEYQALDVKAQIMDNLLLTGGVEQFIDLMVRSRVSRFFSHAVSGYSVEGLDYLIGAIDLARETNRRIILSPRHKADADHLVTKHILEREGLQDFSDSLTWMAGVNMLKRKGIKIFMRAGHIIYIATPDDKNMIEELYKNADGYSFSGEQKERLEEIKKTFDKTNNEAREKVKGVAKRKEPLVVYPEGGRSYDGFMKEPPAEIAAYFPRDGSTLVVPLVGYGSDAINPPNKIVRVYKWIPGFGQHLHIKFGEAYSSSEVWEWVVNMRKEGREVNPADYPMANIANIDPTNIRSAQLLRYRDIMNFRSERISEALVRAASAIELS